MHKSRLLLILSVLLFSICSEAQSLVDFNEARIDITQKGMVVLGTWAGMNLVANPILVRGKSGSEKYFYQMNTYWNTVNLALAGISYFSLGETSLGIAETLQEQYRMEKLLLFNAGLDLAYIAVGALLIERSKNIRNKPERLKGFGQSLILQGSWLFVFDMVFYLIQNHHAKGFTNILSKMAVMPNGFQLVWTF